jgi:galactose mutarotase-like enzyme
MEGRVIDEIVLEAPGLLSARFVSYGATLVGVLAAGRDGSMEEVTLSQDLENLLHHPRFFGSTVGRYANRYNVDWNMLMDCSFADSLIVVDAGSTLVVLL